MTSEARTWSLRAMRWLVLLPLLAACTSEDIIRLQPADIDVPNKVEFGEVARAQSRTLNVTIKNTGDQPLAIKTFRLTGPDADSFAWTGPEAPYAISPDGSKDVAMTFTPGRVGDFEANFLIGSDDTGDDAQKSILLTGIGRAVEATTIDGGIVVIDGGVEYVDGGVEVIDGGVVPVDGGIEYIDGGVVVIDGGVEYVDGGTIYVDGGLRVSDGGTIYNDGGTIYIDGGVGDPIDGGVIYVDGGTVYVDGGLIFVDGGVNYVDGGVQFIDGGVRVIDGGTVVIDGGVQVTDGGTVVTDGGIVSIDGGLQYVDGGVGPIRNGECPASPNIIWEEDFESCQAITGNGVWSADNGVWQFGASTLCGQGTCCTDTVLDGNYSDGTDSRLISPTIQLPATTGLLYVSFLEEHGYSYASGTDRYTLQISTREVGDAGLEWSAWADIAPYVWGWSPLGQVGVDVSAHQGKTVRFGWFHDTGGNFGYNGPGATIDCVQILQY